MKNSDPTGSLREISVAITVLKRLRNEYYRRPCVEGYALGLFTPHRSRIDRRVKALEDEKTIVHEPTSQAFERNKEIEIQQKQELAIERVRIAAAEKFEERSEKIRKGYLYQAAKL